MIREVTEKEKDAFNKASVHPLQSWEWGEFRKKVGNSVVRLAEFNGKKLVTAIPVTYSHIPKTPFTIGSSPRGDTPTKEILEALKVEGKKKNAIFIKLEPKVIKNKELRMKNEGEMAIDTLKETGAIEGKTVFTPSTFWIDLRPDEDSLMKSFHSKTRYNIRLAERKGVTVVEDNSDKAFEKYLKLFFETTKRQGYYMHSEKYHQTMWQTLHKDLVANRLSPIARLLVAKYKGQILTAWIVFVWHDFLYYPYGGSSDNHREVMSNNLMMWEAIKYGKKLRLTTFDLWGREEGKGFTKFKEGYNPKVVEFIGTWDLPTNPLYKAYTYAEKMRWKFLRMKSKVK
jgi:lipid II:glycine glycyltransferase (peptidoglycan interpeptide bridge formation enzyme)